jgi:hypothetical protein
MLHTIQAQARGTPAPAQGPSGAEISQQISKASSMRRLLREMLREPRRKQDVLLAVPTSQ